MVRFLVQPAVFSLTLMVIQCLGRTRTGNTYTRERMHEKDDTDARAHTSLGMLSLGNLSHLNLNLPLYLCSSPAKLFETQQARIFICLCFTRVVRWWAGRHAGVERVSCLLCLCSQSKGFLFRLRCALVGVMDSEVGRPYKAPGWSPSWLLSWLLSCQDVHPLTT